MCLRTDHCRQPKQPARLKFEAIPELLELMLLQLPLRDILVFQRVCKRWQAVIVDSLSIQKGLFLRPTKDVQLRVVETRGVKAANCTSSDDCDVLTVHLWPAVPHVYHAGTHPPWLESALPSSMDSDIRWAKDESDSQEYRIVVNPLLDVEEPWNQEYFSESLRVRDKFSRPAYRRAKASWKNMLFAQPPLQEVMIRHGDLAHWHLIKARPGQQGLTLGDLHRSKKTFDSTIRAIWGEDGFSRGVPADSSAQVVIDKLGVKPAEEKIETESL